MRSSVDGPYSLGGSADRFSWRSCCSSLRFPCHAALSIPPAPSWAFNNMLQASKSAERLTVSKPHRRVKLVGGPGAAPTRFSTASLTDHRALAWLLRSMASDTPLLGGSPLSTVTGGWSSMTHGGCQQRHPGPRNHKCPRAQQLSGPRQTLRPQHPSPPAPAARPAPPDLRRTRPLARRSCAAQVLVLMRAGGGRQRCQGEGVQGHAAQTHRGAGVCLHVHGARPRGGTHPWGDHRMLRCPRVNPLAGLLPASPTHPPRPCAAPRAALLVAHASGRLLPGRRLWRWWEASTRTRWPSSRTLRTCCPTSAGLLCRRLRRCTRPSAAMSTSRTGEAGAGWRACGRVSAQLGGAMGARTAAGALAAGRATCRHH